MTVRFYLADQNGALPHIYAISAAAGNRDGSGGREPTILPQALSPVNLAAKKKKRNPAVAGPSRVNLAHNGCGIMLL